MGEKQGAGVCLQHGKSRLVKSFGRRQAYESPRGRNPRATGGCLWIFLRPVSAINPGADRKAWRPVERRARGTSRRFHFGFPAW